MNEYPPPDMANPNVLAAVLALDEVAQRRGEPPSNRPILELGRRVWELTQRLDDLEARLAAAVCPSCGKGRAQ